MLAAMLAAGLRVSEIVKLMPSDIDYGKGTVRVNDGKGGRDRVVPINSETLGWLRAWAEKRKALGVGKRRPFFCRIRRQGLHGKPLKRGEAITTRTVQALVTRLAKAAGIERSFGGGKKRKRGLGPHILRHTYATRMLDKGFSIREVQELLGHRSVSTTMVYTHVNPEALRQKVQAEDVKPDDPVAALQAQVEALQEEIAKLRAAP
jgi:integrase/recombinase XerD